MGTPEHSREPCPDRILDDLGGAFGMGIVGGSAYNFLKGTYNSPSGSRLTGGVQAVRMNAPRVGGSFAVWGALFSTFDCSLVYIRQKEDPWNSILAGAATGGLLSMRQGFRPASRAALVGGVLVALLEGAGIVVTKVMSTPQDFHMEEPVMDIAEFPGQAPPTTLETPAQSSSSWFGGLFGGKKEEPISSGSKTHVLESFDAPPVPSFEFK